ncbi:MAG: hypothetical protein JSR85_07240 [Proteobacteria bacterium]|nr:hypothetical protein [Pseudomonadota bacterium]
MKIFIYISLSCLWISPVYGADKNPLPRFASLRSNEVNARVGPGPGYPIEWVYLKAGLPVEVLVEFDTWRKIRDVDGAEGWVHQSMLCSKRHVIVRGDETLMYQDADAQSQPLIRIGHGVVGDLIKCQEKWCQVRIQNFKGWMSRVSLWGVYSEENLK